MSPSNKPLRAVPPIMRLKWSRLSRNAKFTFLAALTLLTFYTTQHFYRFVGGVYAYYFEFVYAASGYRYRKIGCRSILIDKIMLERYGGAGLELRDLDIGDWIRLQRCLGNDDGLRRQGDLTLLLLEMVWRVVDPRKLPGVLGTLLFALWIIFSMLPWMYARMVTMEAQGVVLLDNLLGFLWEIPAHDFPYRRWVIVVAFICVSFLLQPWIIFYAAVCAITVYGAYTIQNSSEVSLVNGQDRFRRELRILESFFSGMTIEKILSVCIMICTHWCLLFFERPIFTWAIMLMGIFLVNKIPALTKPDCHHNPNCTCFANSIFNSTQNLRVNGDSDRELGRQKCFHANLDCACFRGHTPTTLYRRLERKLKEANLQASTAWQRFEESEDARNIAYARMADYDNLVERRRWCEIHHSGLGSHRPEVMHPMVEGEVKGTSELQRQNEELRLVVASQHTKLKLNRNLDLGPAKSSEMRREIQNMKDNEAKLVKNVDRLQARLEDAQRAGQDRLDVQESLRAARVIIEGNTTEIKKLRLENVNLKNQPIHEGSFHRTPCQDSSVCEAEKNDLRCENQVYKQHIAEYDALVGAPCLDSVVCEAEKEDLRLQNQAHKHQIAENNGLVQEAARKLGLQDGQHISLREYLYQSVTAMLNHEHQDHVKRHTCTDGGISEGMSVDVKVHSDHLKYVEKLEAELERLGGNVMGVRTGKWPGTWRAVSRFNYLDTIPPVFSIYEKLFDKVTELTDIIITWNNVPPAWESIRHDYVRHDDWEMVFQSNDILSQKLVEAEILRLCNHLIRLSNYIINQQADVVSIRPVQRDVLTGAIIETRLVLKEGLEVIHAPLAIEYPKRTQLAGTTAERRHLIFVEMNRMVAQLCGAIKKSVKPEIPLPPWEELLQPYSTKRLTYDALVNTLNRYEIDTLHARLKQLVKYMGDIQFAGTEQVPERWKSEAHFKEVHDSNSPLLARAGQLISFWDQIPSPGSLLCPILPELTAAESNVHTTSFLDGNNRTPISDFPTVEIEPERRMARERKDRIQQLVNLLDRQHRQVELHWTAPHTHGNFLNLRNGTPEQEQLRLENEKLWDWIKELEGVCKTSGILLPKWPKNGGFI